MIVPKCISEQLLYNTVRIQTKNSYGTGSFFKFKIDDKNSVIVIITNKHVVNNNPREEVQFSLHTCNEKGEPDSNVEITLNAEWKFHPSQDLCYCYAADLFRATEQVCKKTAFVISNEETIVPNQMQLEDLNALEELVMVGYPVALRDEINNYPVFRRGYTANPPSVDFNMPGIGLVDMACFPGSSGSPIYVLNETGYRKKSGEYVLGGQRILLLGFLVSIPIYSAVGKMIQQALPVQQTQIAPSIQVATNLGYYIKSSQLSAFKTMITNDVLAEQAKGINKNG